MKICGMIVLTAFVAVGCASSSTRDMDLMSPSQVARVIDQSTTRTQRYEGLYNTLDLTGTLRNSSVRQAQLERQADIYQWDRKKLQEEINSSNSKMRNETEVFLSFYTPEKKNDDLNKRTTQWKLYLEADGRRWEGKVTKIRTTVPEVQGWYPYHTRFATPYSVTFPVSTQDVEGKASKFVVTGPMGTATLEFPPVTPL